MRTAAKRTVFFIVAAALTAAVVFSALYASFPLKYRKEVDENAAAHGLGTALVYAVIKAESGFKSGSVSRAGAVGLMQVLPSTAAYTARLYGFDVDLSRLSEPAVNIRLGCAYLKYLLDDFGEADLALCAYNAGEGRVRAWLSEPEYSASGRALDKIPYPETAAYLKKVKKFQRMYTRLYGI